MQLTMKKLFLFFLLLLLLANAFAACGTNTNNTQVSQQSRGDSVGPCSTQYLPTLTTLHALASSAQSVYFVSGVHLYALNAGNGVLRWCIHASNAHSNTTIALQGNVLSTIAGPPPQPDGLSPPIVSNHTIYVSSENSYTYAFDANSGAMIWHQNTGFANTSAPTGVGDMVYVASDSIYALDARNGAVRWHYPTQDVVTSTPVLVNGILYTGSYDGNIYALDAANGSKHWSYQAGGRVYVAPIVDHNIVYFGAGNDSVILTALNAQTGKRLWSFHKPIDGSSALTIADGILYVGSYDFLYALNAQTGAELWHYPIATPLQPLVSNGILYIASFQGGMYALTPRNGRVLWHDPLNGMHAGDVTYPVILGNRLFVETIDLGISPSKAILHALNVSNGIEDWYANVDWNISTIGVAA